MGLGVPLAKISRSRDRWTCEYRSGKIMVSTAVRDFGPYELLKQPYCEKCSLSGIMTAQCSWHEGDTVNRTYALGPYIHVGTDEEDHDLLSKHILGLKQYKSYSVPLGLGMSLGIEHVYPDLLKVDVVTPIPKHDSELKIDHGGGENYNQPMELAKVLSSELGMKLKDAVTKTRPYSQRNRKWRERIGIPKDVYVHNQNVDVRDKSVLLIDDVRTSGGTFTACANSLLANGAKIVNAYVAGRDTEKDWTP